MVALVVLIAVCQIAADVQDAQVNAQMVAFILVQLPVQIRVFHHALDNYLVV